MGFEPMSTTNIAAIFWYRPASDLSENAYCSLLSYIKVSGYTSSQFSFFNHDMKVDSVKWTAMRCVDACKTNVTTLYFKYC